MANAGLSAEARRAKADVAQLAERVLGKDEVTSSILVIGSNLRSRLQAEVVRHSSLGSARAAADGSAGATSYGWQAKRRVAREAANAGCQVTRRSL